MRFAQLEAEMRGKFSGAFKSIAVRTIKMKILTKPKEFETKTIEWRYDKTWSCVFDS